MRKKKLSLFNNMNCDEKDKILENEIIKFLFTIYKLRIIFNDKLQIGHYRYEIFIIIFYHRTIYI